MRIKRLMIALTLGLTVVLALLWSTGGGRRPGLRLPQTLNSTSVPAGVRTLPCRPGWTPLMTVT